MYHADSTEPPNPKNTNMAANICINGIPRFTAAKASAPTMLPTIIPSATTLRDDDSDIRIVGRKKLLNFFINKLPLRENTIKPCYYAYE